MMRTVHRIATLAAALSLALPANAAPLAPARPAAVAEEVAGARVVSWHVYTYGDQVLWVVGEIANTSSSVLLQPSVVARFVDPAGVLALTAEAPLDASYLRPGEVSTFRVTVVDPPPYIRLAALEPKGTPSVSDQPIGSARIVDRRGAFEEIGEDRIFVREDCDPETEDCYYVERVRVRTDNYLVEGTVVNASAVPIRNVRVSVALYNQSGALVNTGVSGAAAVLAPGQSASFSILVYWAPGTTSFTVRAYSDD
ncbi:MAG: FxLYD domain-containing protein [Chloroflexota bacterium]|nr:FxLYD domain-containing protein [Chloroflexota bacterium]